MNRTIPRQAVAACALAVAALMAFVSPVSAQPLPEAPVLPDLAAEATGALTSLADSAAKCAQAADYKPENREWDDTYNDEGTANFWTGLEIAGLLGFTGGGGHTGEVWKCKRSACKGGWLPVVGDFVWAGTSILGHGAAVTIYSYEQKTPIVYTTCTGLGADFLVAQSDARSVDGSYNADAIHGGLTVSESTGKADLTADASLIGAYSYSWSYRGKGSLLGLDETVREAINCGNIAQICDRIPYLAPIDVYGTGSDEDIVSFQTPFA